MLGEHDRRAPLLVEPAQQPISSSPATGSSCEVGSSSSTIRGPARERRASATRCSSPPRELVASSGRAAARCRARARPPPPPRATAAARLAAALERERQLRAHGAHHELRLGVLEQRARDGGQLGRARARACRAPDHTRAGELAAVEVRHQPPAARSSVDLPRPGQAREHDELARLDRSETSRSAGRGARVGVGDRRARARSRLDPPAVPERPSAHDDERRDSELAGADGALQRG